MYVYICVYTHTHTHKTKSFKKLKKAFILSTNMETV